MKQDFYKNLQIEEASQLEDGAPFLIKFDLAGDLRKLALRQIAEIDLVAERAERRDVEPRIERGVPERLVVRAVGDVRAAGNERITVT